MGIGGWVKQGFNEGRYRLGPGRRLLAAPAGWGLPIAIGVIRWGRNLWPEVPPVREAAG